MKVGQWSDLPSRLYSGLILGFVGFLAIFFGGMFLQLAVAFLVFIMHYELAKMQSPQLMIAPKYSSIVALITILLLNYSATWIIFLLVLAISLA
jgi:CDP-diglyceride synthetase